MASKTIWLTIGGLAAIALNTSSAAAGGFGIRFSYNDGPRCSTYSHRYVRHAYAPVVRYRSYAPVVVYDDYAPVRYYRDRGPRVVVHRSDAPRYYYRDTSKYRHHHKVVRHARHAVRRLSAEHRGYDRHHHHRHYYRHPHRVHRIRGHWR